MVVGAYYQHRLITPFGHRQESRVPEDQVEDQVVIVVATNVVALKAWPVFSWPWEDASLNLGVLRTRLDLILSHARGPLDEVDVAK